MLSGVQMLNSLSQTSHSLISQLLAERISTQSHTEEISHKERMPIPAVTDRIQFSTQASECAKHGMKAYHNPPDVEKISKQVFAHMNQEIYDLFPQLQALFDTKSNISLFECVEKMAADKPELFLVSSTQDKISDQLKSVFVEANYNFLQHPEIKSYRYAAYSILIGEVLEETLHQENTWLNFERHTQSNLTPSGNLRSITFKNFNEVNTFEEFFQTLLFALDDTLEAKLEQWASALTEWERSGGQQDDSILSSFSVYKEVYESSTGIKTPNLSRMLKIPYELEYHLYQGIPTAAQAIVTMIYTAREMFPGECTVNLRSSKTQI